MVGFVSFRVLSCILRNIISFLLFNSTHFGLILKTGKGMHVGYPLPRFLGNFYVKVDQVTMYYIEPGNW